MMSDGMTAEWEEFKVGDRVKYVGNVFKTLFGKIGKVLIVYNEDSVIVKFPDDPIEWNCLSLDLEKLDDDWNEERQDIVGQNGNDGSHYEVTWTEPFETVNSGNHGVSIDDATPQEWDSIRTNKALDTQVGGDHYRKLKIQPVEYIHANNIPFIEGCIIKYATRWREKGGFKDIEKIKHFCDLLMELEGNA
jgi:hypothetical protein